MRIMATVPREDVHWGQCFEEFYGPEYCKNLKKDLEKLKDEFYDGNAQRFQREWVVPTANLLRRLRHMGFPVRTRDFIIIHLYNPVDSMFAGEMHFQVGRKAPGTLTLKFTKQNSNGTFVIQPKTLSNADEMKLQEDPLDFLDKVRQEMRDSSMAYPNLLQTLVLITESCKLQRQCAKVIFSKIKENVATTSMNNHFQDIPTAPFMAASIPFNNSGSQWPMAGVNPDVSSMRPDGSFPFPMSFCVKNYVNCGTKPEVVGAQNLLGTGSGHHRMQKGPQTAGVAYRQTRSSTWHSEPEENDETMSPQSFTENNWPRLPPDSLEEVQRRMSDTHLWDATKGGGAPLGQKLPSPNNLMFGQPFKQYGPNVTETNVWSGEVRTSLTDEYTGETSAGQGSGCPERRTSTTEEYAQDSSNATLTVIPPMERRDSAAERTSLTEEYAGEETPFKGTLTEAIANSHKLKNKTEQSGKVSPRTAVVNDYASGQQNVTGGCYQPTGYAFMQRQSVTALPYELQGSSQGMLLHPDSNDGHRTSSLDAYVGSSPTGFSTTFQDPRARSEGNLAVSRTSTVDQYFQNQNPNFMPQFGNYWEGPMVKGKLTNGHAQCGYVQDMTRVQVPASGLPLNGGNCNGMSGARIPPMSESHNGVPSGLEETASSLDSWMSHMGSASLMVQQERLRANSVGNSYRRADEEDISLLSHTSYPSWGSHPAIPMNPNRGLLPVAIEEINNDSRNWQKYAPQNSLN